MEESDGFGYAHREKIADVDPMVFHLQNLSFEALASTGIAGKDEVCHKLHFHRNSPLSFALLTAASILVVEAKEGGLVAHLARER